MFWWGNLREGMCFEDQDVEGRERNIKIDLREI